MSLAFVCAYIGWHDETPAHPTPHAGDNLDYVHGASRLDRADAGAVGAAVRLQRAAGAALGGASRVAVGAAALAEFAVRAGDGGDDPDGRLRLRLIRPIAADSDLQAQRRPRAV